MTIEQEMVRAHQAGMQLYRDVAAGKTTVADIFSVATTMYDTPHERIAYMAGFAGARKRAMMTVH